ncbi:hypothetical protein HYC85_000810 [Camellia sinensis]|uniref:Uncharacterized protein n=1 Tax=Camellia sinensis TaxID=4442 RepID=A0A7J7I4T7_CAMSI|nr:hypothetical protein HYC85_000810 [Camellia sinensis]
MHYLVSSCNFYPPPVHKMVITIEYSTLLPTTSATTSSTTTFVAPITSRS